MFLFNSFSVVFSVFHRATEVLDASTSFKDHNPTGEITEGSIRVKGPLVDSNASEIRWTHTRSAEQYGHRKTGNTYHLLMGYKPWSARMCHPQLGDLKVGLILELLSEKKNRYRRVGMFMHPRLEYVSDPEEAHPTCTEFADFGPENYQCTEVEII